MPTTEFDKLNVTREKKIKFEKEIVLETFLEWGAG